MKKKVLAAVLALTMVVASSTSVFATEITAPAEGVYGADLNVDTGITVPTIKITVPATMGEVMTNPYKMEYTVGSDKKTDQIIAVDNEIKNESNVPIAVNIASILGTIGTGSEAAFVTAAPTEKITTKAVFMYMEVIKDGDDYADAYDAKSANQLLVGAKAVSKNAVVTLDKGNTTATKAKFTFKGSLATNPAKAWTSNDKFNVAVKFTFTPQVAPVAAP